MHRIPGDTPGRGWKSRERWRDANERVMFVRIEFSLT